MGYPWAANDTLTTSDLNTAFAARATLTGTETLTNKTLSGATLSGATTLPGSGQLSSAGWLGLGGTPAAQLHLQGGASAAAWTTVGIGMRLSAATFTDTSSSGTVADTGVHAVNRPTIAASSAVTYTIASTLRIANSPAAGTNVTITNPYAVHVVAGASRFDDAVLVHGGTAMPAGGTTGAGLRLSATANFGVFFGSGAPTLSAAKGSLYLRSNGSGTGDRAYINSDGGTTWVALTTAA